MTLLLVFAALVAVLLAALRVPIFARALRALDLRTFTVRRSVAGLVVVAMAMCVGTVVAWATTPLAGNGRGDVLANRPTCSSGVAGMRGRVFDLYNADGTKSDVIEFCALTSAGGLGWKTAPFNLL